MPRLTDPDGVICPSRVSRPLIRVMKQILRFPRSIRDERPRGPEWTDAVRAGLFAYLLSRVFVIVGCAIAGSSWAVTMRDQGKIPPNGPTLLVQVLDSWDGKWYLEVVRTGYPRFIPTNVNYYIPEARAAFFPLYPRLVHYIDMIVPAGPVSSALLVNFIFGWCFVYLAGRLAAELFGVRTAHKAMVILCLFPGSFVLSFAYSEATLLVLAALTFLALRRHAWVWAGVLASLGGLARPNGVALGVACLAVAVSEFRSHRNYGPVVSVLLSPVGFVGFMIFLRHHTGEPWPWFRVQREAWDEGASFGGTAVARTFDFVTRPLSSPTSATTAACVVFLVVLVFLWRRHRLPIEMTAYSASVVFLMLMPATVTARPRFIFTAFPLFFCLAAVFRDDDDKWWPVMTTVLGASLVAFAGLYGVFGAVP